MHNLPRSWATLHALCGFPEDVLEMMIAKRKINSDIERPEVEEMLRELSGGDVEDKPGMGARAQLESTKRGNSRARKPLSEDEKRVTDRQILGALVECMIGSPDQHSLQILHQAQADIEGLEKLSDWVARFAENAPSRESAEQVKYDESSRPKSR